METVKAVINVGEVTIQLEGPREFVERYLDQYQSIIEKGLTSTSISRVTSKETKVEKAEKPAPKRTRTVRPKAGPACGEKIREIIGEGFKVLDRVLESNSIHRIMSTLTEGEKQELGSILQKLINASMELQ